MLPAITDSDLRNEGLAYPIAQSYGTLGLAFDGPYFKNVRCGQFAAYDQFPSGDGVPPLGDHIDAVGLVASCPEMGRVDASSDVAGMAHAKTVWDGAVGKNPRNSVRLPWLPVKLEGSIPVAVHARGPKPALVRSAPVYLRPKASGKINFSHDDLLGVVVVRGAASGSNPVRASSF